MALRWKRVFSFLGVTYLVGFVAFMIYDWTFNEPKARRVQQSLAADFRSIPSMPGAELLKKNESHKTHQALVGATYASRATYGDIAKYFDEELRKAGWTYMCEGGVRDWGRDFGGRSRAYRKGEYCAAIQYAGERANYGWAFGFDLTWGSGCNCR